MRRPVTPAERAADPDGERVHRSLSLPWVANGDDALRAVTDPVMSTGVHARACTPFRIARLLWSLPYSCGFGRRLRLRMVDRSNEQAIGARAIQAPPLRSPAGDRLFRSPDPAGKKTEMVAQAMDMHPPCVAPPCHWLLRMNPVALAAASNGIRRSYRHAGRNRLTAAHQPVLSPRMGALTPMIAFGRGSASHRFRYGHAGGAGSPGHMEGYGIVLVTSPSPLLRAYLKREGVSPHRFRRVVSGGPVLHAAERICFEKRRIGLQGYPPVDVIRPGRPLCGAVIDAPMEQRCSALQRGAILGDERDGGMETRTIVFTDHAIRGARMRSSGEHRRMSHRFLIQGESPHDRHTAQETD